MNSINCQIPCLCCDYPSLKFYFCKQSSHGEFPICRCPSCGSAFVWPRPDKDAMEAYYKDNLHSDLTYEQAIQVDLRYYPNSAGDSKRIIAWCLKLSRGYEFLDVGAGFGAYSKTANEYGFTVTACEPNPNAIKHFFEMNGFYPDPSVFDYKYASLHKEEFDVVLLSQVLEHVSDPVEVVDSIHTVLRGNGVAAIAVPHFGSALSRIQKKNDMYISPPEHLNFFSKRGLIDLFLKRGFKLEFLETVSKVPRERIKEAVRVPVLSDIAWRGSYGALTLFDSFNMGMMINAYFRRKS